MTPEPMPAASSSMIDSKADLVLLGSAGNDPAMAGGDRGAASLYLLLNSLETALTARLPGCRL